MKKNSGLFHSENTIIFKVKHYNKLDFKDQPFEKFYSHYTRRNTKNTTVEWCVDGTIQLRSFRGIVGCYISFIVPLTRQGGSNSRTTTHPATTTRDSCFCQTDCNKESGPCQFSSSWGNYNKRAVERKMLHHAQSHMSVMLYSPHCIAEFHLWIFARNWCFSSKGIQKSQILIYCSWGGQISMQLIVFIKTYRRSTR